jgi:hypothetical protein
VITLDNLEVFATQLRLRGIDAMPESKHDAIKGVQVGLVIDQRFYSLTELNLAENQKHDWF